jgi:hypothetical protein
LLSFTPIWLWFLPALGWGVGLAIHGLVAFTTNEQDFLEHDRGMQWWLENRHLRHERRLARLGPRKRRIAEVTSEAAADEDQEEPAQEPAVTRRRR